VQLTGLVQHTLEICGKIRLKGERLPGDRMGKGQPIGVEKLVIHAFKRS